MKRKLLLLLSLVFVMATTLVCAVGCKQNSKPTHKHSYAATWSTDGTNHWHECECGDKIDLEAHKGGTATCTEKAECEVCRVKYGEVNANNHAGSEFNYVSNGNGTHKKTYECCGATAAESEACSGGTATCKEQVTCEHCKAKYGNVSTDNHVSTEVKYVSKGNGKHDILYKCCDAVKEADVACSGGQATECGKKNVCEHCNTEYGTALAHDLEHHAAKEATCTEKGWKAYDTCKRGCGYTTYEEVAPTGHSYKEHEKEAAATYFEKGRKTVYQCEKCQNNFYLDGETYVEITSETDLVIPYKTIISETTAAARDTSSTDLINEFVDSKVKECDDTVTKFVNIAKDGTTVKAAYFARTTSWAEKEDSAQNYGFIEVRIPTDVTTIIGVTFEYRLVDRNTDKCTNLETNDKAYGMKSYIEYKHSDAYTNNSKDTFGDTAFVADGAWHKTNLYCAQDNMQNVLFKIYHLDGEFVITNLHLITSFAGDATATTIADDSTDLIKSIVHLDSSNMNKIKIYDQSEPNYVTTTGINGDTVTALYFTKIQGLTVADDYDEDADGKRTNKNNWGFSEFRITVSGKITKLSFDYRLVDSNTEICETVYASGVLNPSDKNMGMKSFLEYKSSTNGYNCRTLEKYGNTLFEADGQWHHIEFEYTEEGMQNILFKIYHLQGEFMVTNIQATMA